MNRSLSRWIFSVVLLFAPGVLAAQEAEAPTPARGSLVEDRAARKLIEAGDLRFDSDEHLKAVEIWQSVIERYPRSKVRYDAHMRLGNFLLERDRAYDRARTHFEAVSAEQNSDEEQRAEATLKMGICFYEARNFGKCFKVMRDVIEQFPVSPQVNQAYYYIGLGHFELGHYSRAIEALERVGTALSAEEGKAEKVEAGKRLFVKIEDADLAALEPGRTIKVRCKSGQGDVEDVECFAVGRNVRIVLGSLLTSLGKPRPDNGVLEVRGDDKVEITYTDEHTADKQFNIPVLKEVEVVGNAVAEVMDGAFNEHLLGVVLDRGVNVQITDADRDLTDEAEKIKAVVEVYREKTADEIEAETTEAAAKALVQANPTGTPAADKPEGEPTEPEINRFKLIDRMEVELVEAKLEKKAIEVPSAPVEEAEPAADAKASETKAEAKPAESKAPEAKSAKPAATEKAAAGAAPKAAPNSTKPAAEGGKTAETTEATESEEPAPRKAPPEPEVDDGSIHSGAFRVVVELVTAEEVIEGDDILQAIPGDIVQVTYVDEKNRSPGVTQAIAKVKCVEGNLGGVRVTRAQISDQELRIKTQLKTADALTNIGNRYKEFGLQRNAVAKYDQALKVCEDISEEAAKLGGRLLEETYVQLWHIYYEMDRLELAAAMSQRLQREFPNSEFVDDALLKLAEVSRKQGDLQRAVGIYNRLVVMEGSQLRGEAQYGIAECYEEMANQQTAAAQAQLLDRAFQEYKKVFDSFPESGRVGEAVAKMAEHYYRQKDYSRAIDTFETVLNDHQDAKFLDVILFNYGRCLYRMEKKNEARKQFDQLISDYPESPLATDAKRISEALAKAGF